MNKRKNILICPLEWGLGHAARMIPVAGKLRQMDHNIFIGAGEEHLSLFRAELPGLTLITFPGFKPAYSKHLPQYLIMLLKVPVLIYHIILEHHRLKKIIEDNHIDIVISDNRFGLWNKNIVSVYFTHLMRIPFPGIFRPFEWIGVFLHRQIIKRYTFCFIPDLPGELNVSGKLSHSIKLPGNVRFSGILSRFIQMPGITQSANFPFPHKTVILSGPEPQRGILKKKLTVLLREEKPETIMLEGKPGSTEINKEGNILCYDHLTAGKMQELLRSSEIIISRSGYTTIMDLICLNCTALLIPTPGQTEQEYLAAYLSDKGWFSTVSQGDIKEGLILGPGHRDFPGMIINESATLLDNALAEMLEE